MKTKKSKLLKTISFSSLALLMGIAGTMAFAPLGANPNALATASETEYTTEQGLITPKADDPTLYTTESGLDIKFGLAMPTINASLPSGNLTGFPYFTTTSGSITYTWVIIGRNSDVAMLSGGMLPYLYSQWKGNLSLSGSGAEYYFSNVDTTTPAGALIDTQASSKAYVYDKGIDSSITVNDTEIPSGCVLVLANSVVATNVYYHSSQRVGYSGSSMHTTFVNYYNNDTFGFGAVLSSIAQTDLIEFASGSNTSVNDQYFFPLGTSYCTIYSNGYVDRTTNENYRVETYLTEEQRIAYNSSGNAVTWWGRTSWQGWGVKDAIAIKEDGTLRNLPVNNFSSSYPPSNYRPAFVLKIT